MKGEKIVNMSYYLFAGLVFIAIGFGIELDMGNSLKKKEFKNVNINTYQYTVVKWLQLIGAIIAALAAINM